MGKRGLNEKSAMVLDNGITTSIASIIERIPGAGIQNNRFESPGTASCYCTSPNGAKD